MAKGKMKTRARVRVLIIVDAITMEEAKEMAASPRLRHTKCTLRIRRESSARRLLEKERWDFVCVLLDSRQDTDILLNHTSAFGDAHLNKGMRIVCKDDMPVKYAGVTIRHCPEEITSMIVNMDRPTKKPA